MNDKNRSKMSRIFPEAGQGNYFIDVIDEDYEINALSDDFPAFLIHRGIPYLLLLLILLVIAAVNIRFTIEIPVTEIEISKKEEIFEGWIVLSLTQSRIIQNNDISLQILKKPHITGESGSSIQEILYLRKIQITKTEVNNDREIIYFTAARDNMRKKTDNEKNENILYISLPVIRILFPV